MRDDAGDVVALAVLHRRRERPQEPEQVAGLGPAEGEPRHREGHHLHAAASARPLHAGVRRRRQPGLAQRRLGAGERGAREAGVHEPEHGWALPQRAAREHQMIAPHPERHGDAGVGGRLGPTPRAEAEPARRIVEREDEVAQHRRPEDARDREAESRRRIALGIHEVDRQVVDRDRTQRQRVHPAVLEAAALAAGEGAGVPAEAARADRRRVGAVEDQLGPAGVDQQVDRLAAIHARLDQRQRVGVDERDAGRVAADPVGLEPTEALELGAERRAPDLAVELGGALEGVGAVAGERQLCLGRGVVRGLGQRALEQRPGVGQAIVEQRQRRAAPQHPRLVGGHGRDARLDRVGRVEPTRGEERVGGRPQRRDVGHLPGGGGAQRREDEQACGGDPAESHGVLAKGGRTSRRPPRGHALDDGRPPGVGTGRGPTGTYWNSAGFPRRPAPSPSARRDGGHPDRRSSP